MEWPPLLSVESFESGGSMSSLFIILALFLVLSFVPLLFLFGRAYLRFRGPRMVTCPETGGFAKVNVDAAKAAFSSISDGVELNVTSCDRWPANKECKQGCVDESAPAPQPIQPAAARS
jgi:hypothetical protein